jgi:hypothetical protein
VIEEEGSPLPCDLRVFMHDHSATNLYPITTFDTVSVYCTQGMQFV